MPAKKAGGGKTSTGGASASVPFIDHSGTRLLASHCPGCMEELKQTYMFAYYLDAGLTRRVGYYLCKPCGQRLERFGRSRRKRFAETVERNLWALGALDGLERRGGVEA